MPLKFILEYVGPQILDPDQEFAIRGTGYVIPEWGILYYECSPRRERQG